MAILVYLRDLVQGQTAHRLTEHYSATLEIVEKLKL